MSTMTFILRGVETVEVTTTQIPTLTPTEAKVSTSSCVKNAKMVSFVPKVLARLVKPTLKGARGKLCR